MKKYSVLLLGLTLLFSHIGMAQFTVGGKASIISNDVVVTSGATNLHSLIRPTTGFAIGAFGEYALNDSWSVQSELNFKRTGFQVSEGTSFSVGGFQIPLGATVEARLSYLELPLVMKYSHDMGNLKGYVLAGPNVNYALSGELETTANSILDFTINTTEINLKSNAYNRWALGGVVGAGLAWPVSPDISINGEIRYNHDFTSAVEVPLIDAGVRNKGWHVGIGVGKRI